MRWGKVTIMGVGLLGGSIGTALKQRKLAGCVAGYVRRKSAVRECLEAGVVDEVGLDVARAVEGADLVVLCTPISDIVPLGLKIRERLKPGAIVTDVGSIKGPIIRGLGAPLRRVGAHFVGSHPMAGSERWGVEAATPDLFKDAICVITPDAKSDSTAVRKVGLFWKSLGSRLMTVRAAQHDRWVSRASHLPHLVASALANQVLDPRQDRRVGELCASGFRDTTRVAAGSPAIWKDIALANRSNLIGDLQRLEDRLASLREALQAGDADEVSRFLSNAQSLREAWGKRRTSTGAE